MHALMKQLGLFLDMVVHVVIGLQASLESTKKVRQSCITMLANVIHKLTSIYIHKLRRIHASQLKVPMQWYELIQRVGLLLKPPLPATNEEVDMDNIASMLPTNEPANKQQLHPNLNTTAIGCKPR